MNLHRMLVQRAEEGRPLRIGLIGAGKFGCGPCQRHCAQIVQRRPAAAIGKGFGCIVQRAGKAGQNGLRHAPAIMFDQIQITGRQPRRLRHIALPQPQSHPPRAQF